ncbi:protein YgfX [Edwardsiella anguillarum]|uniref:protein YgfX n=1 Tax=Edwardsiella anguillarum TaxID=1821960 RepID=UPI0024B775F8|nr:protein YgfX [Edwardsiella anguillarum]WHP79783.1 protein YgfX [Edwardsiella anguillarum]WHQ17243.1 protein YgfX [Edwardsiella anguillarum]WHQ20779.1 protein YgfX [Edwardsiella anguillarum]WHQ24300.1 protein YgfX [Edwardsiella anguillarum]WHQ27870.1 protein YgfX [Edwardsiella anguillarum]
MVLWRCNVHVSWRTQVMFLLGHGALVLAILLAPWPENYSAFWLVLLVAVIFECIRSQRRIARNRGELQLLAPQVWHWQLREWRLARRPWVSDLGALLILQSTHGVPCRRRLWLAADSMSREEWGQLRRTLLDTGDDRA